jgi:myo-inositol 2-dehydrogenase/D-chiro-inositol 1-dehydrogenase
MTVRVGVIGLGGIAQAHLDSLSKIGNAKLVGVYDIQQERAQAVSASTGAQIFGSASEMVDHNAIDALFICTPQFARDDTEERAARAGIHVLVEKPLGLNLEAVQRKERAIRESGVINSSGYCLRYLDTVQKAKAYLADKQIDLINACRFGGLYAPPWWRNQHMSGGQFVDQTTHQVDLIRYLAGDITEVYARFERRSIAQEDPEGTIYDVGTVSIRTETGAVGSISNTCLSPHYSRGEVEIFGRNFYLSIEGASLKIHDEHQKIAEKSDMNFYLEQDMRFIEAVQTGQQSRVLCSYSEALKTLAVTLAANQSAEQLRPVSLGKGVLQNG